MRRLYILFALVLMFASCAKEGPVGPKGDTGAQGPQGATGQQGPAGQNGTNGTNGTNGNANVKSYSFTANAWTQTGTSGTPGQAYIQVINFPQITQSIFDNGNVMVYKKSTDGTQWLAMPFSINYSSYIRTWRYSFKVGSLTLFSEDSDGLTPNPNSIDFRFILMTSSGRMAHPNLDYNDYEAVKQAFNLAD